MAKSSKKKLNPPVVRDADERIDWVTIKRDYLATQKITKRELADKHKVPYNKLRRIMKKEDWDGLKKEVKEQVDRQIMEQAKDEILQMRKRHSQIGRKVLHEGIRAIEQGKTPKKAKDALSFVEKGIDIEREAEGLNDKGQRPSVVNIIKQQGSVLERYKVEEGEIVEDGEK